MATELKLPDLGEDIESGQVTRVLVQPGDAVEPEQSVIELETDKATVEVPADLSGRVAEVLVQEGDEIQSGDVILTLKEGAEAGGARQDAETAEEEADQEAEQAEEKPAAEEKPPEKEDEAESEAAPEAEGEEVSPSPPESKEKAEQPVPAEVEEQVGGRLGAGAEGMPALDVRAAPSVRRYARQAGVDIADVPPGPGGRISREDVERYVGQKGAEEAAAPRPSAVSLPDFEKWGPVRREEMSPVRSRIAEHMRLSWSQIPHVTQHDLANVTALEAARKRLAKKADESGVKLTVTAVALKVAAAALAEFPRFNSSLDPDAGEIIYKEYRHVGVAVATERGLLVPVIRDVDEKGLAQIARELSELAEKARDGSIEPGEMKGGTFTVTNIGGIGGTYFTPIINFPEVAILGLGRIYKEPGGAAASSRLMLPLSLSYDHRVIDGAEGAEFLRWIADALEAPLALLMGE